MKCRVIPRLWVVSLAALLIVGCKTRAQEQHPHFDAETFVPTYTLPTPVNWMTERFGIPIEFAPRIPYDGIEDLRFAPGWSASASEDYWTYSYLWYLNGKITFTPETIAENLDLYYTGLVGRNIEKRKIPKEKLFPVKATFEVVEKQGEDKSTFQGSVHMLDYMAQQPITLNFLVHVKECPGKNMTYVFYEVSPRERSHPVWKTLQKIWIDFNCDVK